MAVTAIANIAKEEAEKGEVYYRRGRGGTNLGRAVHSVLQSVDLATAIGLEHISKAQAEAEGIPRRWQEVAELAKRGIESSIVGRAVASGNYYREVFVSAALENGLVEGFVDLLFEDDGIVIADYKTDIIDDDMDEKRLEQYKLQAGAYALAISEVIGRTVKEVVLVFVRSGKEICLGNTDELREIARDKAAAVLR